MMVVYFTLDHFSWLIFSILLAQELLLHEQSYIEGEQKIAQTIVKPRGHSMPVSGWHPG